MKDMVKKTVDVLKEKVKSNLLEIQSNQMQIRELLKQPVSAERSTQLEEKYAINKVLLAENNDFINIQLSLSNFMEKYSNSNIFDTQAVTAPCACTSEGECFEMTINGVLSFNAQHPFYEDDNFFHKLMKYYQDVEDYENCDKLVKEKSLR
jgi:hypothetical protein